MIGKAFLFALGFGTVWAVNRYLINLPSFKQAQ